MRVSNTSWRSAAWIGRAPRSRSAPASSSSQRGPFNSPRTGDLYGWHQAVDGKWFLTIFVETGRVKDMEGRRLKTALRQFAEKFPKPNSVSRPIKM